MVGNSRVNISAPKVLALGFLSMFVLVGCQQAPVINGRFVSEQGVNIEAAFPADIFLLMKLGTRDAGQLASLEDLNAYFPNDPLGTIASEFVQGMKQGTDLPETGLDFEKDIMPILSKKTEVYLAGAGNGQSIEKVNGVLAMTLSNEEKFDLLLNKQVDKGTLSKQVYNGFTYYTQSKSDGQPSMIVRMKDVAFLFTDLKTMKTGLDNLSANKVVLDGNTVYQRAVKEYSPSIAFVFGDFSKLMAFLNSVGAEGDNVAKVIGSMVADTRKELIESEVIMATVEKDGIRLVANVLGKEGSDLSSVAGQMSAAYLSKQIPAKFPVMYSEAYNLKQSFESILKLAENDTEMANGIKEMRAFFADQDLDLEKDVLSFLDKGYAFVMEDTESVIPAMGIYVDVSSNPAGAAKVAQKVNAAFDEIWLQAQTENPQLPSLLKKEEVVPGKLWKFAAKIDALLVGAPPEIIKKLSGQKLEVYYGLLDQNVLTVAFKADLEKVYGKSPNVSEASEYKQALGLLKGADKGVVFMAPNQLFVFADRVLKMVKEVGGSLGDMTEYEMVKSYVMPVKSLSTATSDAEKNKLKAEAFIHIAQ